MKTKSRLNKLTTYLLTLAMLLTLMPSFTLTAVAADEPCGNHDNVKIQLSWNADKNKIYYTGMDTLPQVTWCVAYIYKGTEQSENNLLGSQSLDSYDSSFELPNWGMVLYTVTVLAKFSDGCVKTVSDTLSIEIIPEIRPIISYSKDTGSLHITGAGPIPTGCAYTLYVYQVDENNVEHEIHTGSITNEFEGATIPVHIYMSQMQLYRIVIKNGNTILSNVVEVDKRSNGDASIKNLVCCSGAQAGQFEWSAFPEPEGVAVCYIVKLFKNGTQFYQTITRSTGIDLVTLMGYWPAPSLPVPSLPAPSLPGPQAGEVLQPGNTYTISVQAAEITAFSNGGTYLAGEVLSDETMAEGFVYTDLALAPGTLQIRPYSTETLLEAVNFTGFLKDRVKYVHPGALPNTVTFGLSKDGTWKDFDGNTPVTAVSEYDRLSLISFEIYGIVTIPVNTSVINNIEFLESSNITITDAENGTVTTEKSVAYEGETVFLTVTPDKGYLLEALTVKQGETDVSVTNNAFTMPAGDVTVSATFKPCTHETYKDGKCTVCGTTCDHGGENSTYDNGICDICGEVLENIIVGYDEDERSAIVTVKDSDTYSLIFVKYGEGNRLDKVEVVEFLFKKGKNTVRQERIDFILGKDDKIMLCKDMTTLVPLCEAYIVK